VDERVDVWAAGCVLYFLMVGESPFERAANEAGGSLMLAVVK
jgi:serine/threonine protein kinase